MTSEQDDRSHLNVALINQTAARRLWPGQNPLGARVHTGAPQEPWRTIVGVVGDVYQYGLDSPKTMQLYYPYRARRWFRHDAAGGKRFKSRRMLGSAVRQAVFSVDKDQPLSDIAPLEQVLADSMAGRRFSMLLLTLFASQALALAAVGIYGVISYSVTQRTNEFGIRMALGARTGDIMALVIRQGVLLILAGTLIGLAASFAMTRLLASLFLG